MACRTCKDGVILKPFSHQVGGHAGMLKYNNLTVCKPLKQRELLFYQNLQQDMVPFTPAFRGTVDVCIEEQQDGTLFLRAYPCFQMATSGRCTPDSSGEGVDSDEEECCGSTSSNKHNHKSKYHANKKKSSCTVWSCNGSVCIEDDSVLDAGVFEDHSNTCSKPTSPCNTTPYNPWGLHCHHKQVAKMRRDQKNHKFILLENVTSQFQYPCVLDLKMGTRSYGDDFSEEKRKSHIAKAESTTSATLGMRICGMQVFNPDTGKFVCRNKYYGRRLSKDGLMKGLRDFLHNGHRVRTELISHIIHKLQRLIEIVSQQNSLRLYSSSLLIMYEGNRSDDDQSDDAEQDFCFVDIRMIDFANTCHKGQKKGTNTPLHNGPDKGYMYGLDNLVQMLHNLLPKSERLKDMRPTSEQLQDARPTSGTTSKSELSAKGTSELQREEKSGATLEHGKDVDLMSKQLKDVGCSEASNANSTMAAEVSL